MKIIKYILTGLTTSLKVILDYIKHVFLGLFKLPMIIIHILSHFFLTFRIAFGAININKQKKYKQKAIKRQKQKQLVETKKKKKNIKESYISENAHEFKKQGPIEKLGNLILSIPRKIKRKLENNSFIKNAKHKKDINREVLVIDFNGEDAKRSDTKQTYQYEIKTPEGKYVTGYFDAYSKVEVHSFLLSEGNTVYSIKTDKWIRFLHGTATKKTTKIKTKDLIFLLAQLSTYLKAGIPLVDSVKILKKQFKNPNYQKILRGVIYDLSTGKSFSEALTKQENAFPKLLINMIKTSEMTGELPETLDDMESYYTETEATRKAMVSAMMYPTIIFIIAIGVGLFIMLYVVPKFVDIYNSMDNAEIPAITKFVLGLSNFLSNYAIWLGIGSIALIILLAYLYNRIPTFKLGVQWLGMHLPVFGNVIIYNEVTMFTKTFSSLLAHNVFITDSMDILNKVTNNEIYRIMINEAISNIAKGGKISEAFKDQWSFPIPAYEMIVTGEKTGQLPEMMSKVSTYYQDLHKNSVSRIKTFIEPVMIIMLTVMVGVIVLSIVVPMFNMYGAIQQ